MDTSPKNKSISLTSKKHHITVDVSLHQLLRLMTREQLHEYVVNNFDEAIKIPHIQRVNYGSSFPKNISAKTILFLFNKEVIKSNGFYSRLKEYTCEGIEEEYLEMLKHPKFAFHYNDSHFSVACARHLAYMHKHDMLQKYELISPALFSQLTHISDDDMIEMCKIYVNHASRSRQLSDMLSMRDVSFFAKFIELLDAPRMYSYFNYNYCRGWIKDSKRTELFKQRVFELKGDSSTYNFLKIGETCTYEEFKKMLEIMPPSCIEKFVYDNFRKIPVNDRHLYVNKLDVYNTENLLNWISLDKKSVHEMTFRLLGYRTAQHVIDNIRTTSNLTYAKQAIELYQMSKV